MEQNIGLEVVSAKDIMGCIKAVRKYAPEMTMGEIKNKIGSGELMLEYDAVDDEGLAKIIACHNELRKTGAKMKTYWLNREVPYSTLKNLSGTFAYIDSQFED